MTAFDSESWACRGCGAAMIGRRPAHDLCPDCSGAASGPVETEAQARELPAVRAAYDAAHASSRRGVLAERNHRLLCEALSAAGVELGAYDHRIMVWLAGWGPQTCRVVAGWITRAHRGGERP